MTSLDQLLERASKGEFGDLRQEVDDRSVRIIGLSNSSVELGKVMEALLSFESIEKIRFLESADSLQKYDPKELVNVSRHSVDGEGIVRNFLHYEYENPSALKKSAQIMLLSDMSKASMAKALACYDSRFSAAYDELGRNRNNTESCSRIRAGLDRLSNGFLEIASELGRRGVSVGEEMSSRFKCYQQDRKIMADAERRISELRERYLSMHLSADPQAEAKEVIASTRNAVLWKSPLAKQCNGLGYYEGIIALEELHSDAKQVYKDLERYVTLRNSAESDCTTLDRRIGLLASGEQYPEDALKKMASEFPSCKYSKDSGVMFLDDALQAYSSKAESYNGMVCKMLARCEQEKRLREIDGYKSTIDELSQGLRSASQEFSDKKSELEQQVGELNAQIEGMRESSESESRRLAESYQNDLAESQKRFADAESRYNDQIGALQALLAESQRENASSKEGYQEILRMASEYRKEAESLRSEMASASAKHQELVAGLFERIGSAEKTFREHNDRQAGANAGGAPSIEYREVPAPSMDKDNRFYDLYKFCEGLVVRPWKDRLENISWFVEDAKGKGVFLSSEEDFKIAEHVYASINSRWRAGKIASRQHPCLDERLRVSDALGALHNYIEQSRALYDAR